VVSRKTWDPSSLALHGQKKWVLWTLSLLAWFLHRWNRKSHHIKQIW
jgi:hypothetical protein